jgi:hypothetical protein
MGLAYINYLHEKMKEKADCSTNNNQLLCHMMARCANNKEASVRNLLMRETTLQSCKTS